MLPGSHLVSRGHTPFRKRGKGSGNFRCSRLLHRNSLTPHCASAKLVLKRLTKQLLVVSQLIYTLLKLW